MASKAELIYEALLRVNGGLLTSDSTTRYGEAETYLVAAVNYVQLGNYWIEGKAESERTVNQMMLTAFNNVPILYDATYHRKYSDLPSRAVIFPKARSIEVTTACGKKLIPLSQGDDAMQEYYGKYSKQIKYQLENGTRLWYWGLEKYPLIDSVRPKYIVNVGDVAADAELLLPADGEVKVLDMLVAWLKDEKLAPKHYVENAKDTQ